MITPDQKMWMTGGLSTQGRINSTIFIMEFLNGPTESGPNLPEGLSDHAIVSINETSSLLIGGLDGTQTYLDTTYYFSHETEKWSEGPKSIQATKAHTAGLVTDKVTQETFVIVVGLTQYNSKLHTTEILMDGSWVSGENPQFDLLIN